METEKAHLEEFGAKCRKELLENIMPFWMEHGWDREHGGVYTCLDRRGELMDPTKSVWFQGRFAYVLSYAYNRVEENPEWLAAAKSSIDFSERHCFDARGRMYFEVMADGTPKYEPAMASQGHSLTMILINVATVLKQISDDPVLDDQIDESAWLLSGEKRYFDRFRLAANWAWTHLKDPDFPEWFGYLHRDGTVAQPAKGNIFKGPFHIPRMLVRCCA